MVKMQPPKYFEEVRNYASDLWTNKQRAGERNSNKMLLQQISDIRYVISELLQNADDAGATWANVRIDGNMFIFEHNGRDFTKEDFTALCSFAVSNKTTCQTIGFRGIGFKATFSIGNQIYVRTPTLSIYFLRKKFTEPVWDDTDYPHKLGGLTRISVEIENDFVENGLKESFNDWIKSNYSLLFFKHLKEMKIEKYSFKISKTCPGPVKNSIYLTLNSSLGSPIEVLKISSKPLPPPSDVVDEVRDIRNMDESGDLAEVPPFVIDIILGIPNHQSLYTVLPTLTKTDLNISMNAPFVLTPDRKITKHPGQSPTNRWLLEEVGNLIVDSLKEWLENPSLSIDERVEAYTLLQPKNVTEYGDILVNEAISTYLSKTNIVLDIDGSFQPRCLSIPEELYSIWDKKILFEFFNDSELPIIEKAANKHIKLLKDWNLATDDAKFLARLLYPAKIPRPETTKQLYLLWGCVSKAHKAAYNNSIKHKEDDSIFDDENIKKYQVFPIQNELYLQSAENTMRVCPYLDESVPQKYLTLVNSYIEFIDSSVDKEIQNNVKTLPKDARRLLEDTIGLDIPTIKDVLDNLSAFVMDDDDVIILAHMYMHWDLEVPKESDFEYDSSFEYVSSSGERICIADSLVYYDNHDILSTILSKEERDSKILSPLYEEQLNHTEEKEKWIKWVISEKSHISQPLKLNDEYGDFSLPDDSVQYIDTYFNENPEGKNIWADCLSHILEIDENYYQKIHNRKGSLAKWVVVFKERPCIYGNDGKAHLPNEVYWKNKVTELLDGEIFIRDDYLDISEDLLKELGVQYTPGYPEALIKKLKSLSANKSTDLSTIFDYYNKLDKIVDSVKDKKTIIGKIREDFQKNDLAYTDKEIWAPSSKVYRNETDIPRTYCLHPDVASLLLWNTLQFSSKPSLDDSMNYLKTLKENKVPSVGELGLIKKILSLHPEEVLGKVKCWLSIDNHWKNIGSFEYYILDEKDIPGLYPEFKAKIPQLSLIKKDQRSRLCTIYFTDAIDILNKSTWRAVDIEIETEMKSINFPWMVKIGQFFINQVPKTHQDYETLQELGELFINTRLLTTKSFYVAPFYNGKRIGLGKDGRIKWDDETIYSSLKAHEVSTEFYGLITQNPLVKELNDEELVKVLCYIIERDSATINTFLTRHFKIEPEEEEEYEDYSNETSGYLDEEDNEPETDFSDKESESQEDSSLKLHQPKKSNGGSLRDSIQRKTHDGSSWPSSDDDLSEDEDEYSIEPDFFDPEKYEQGIADAQYSAESEYRDSNKHVSPYTQNVPKTTNTFSMAWERDVGTNDIDFEDFAEDTSPNDTSKSAYISISSTSFRTYSKSNTEERAFLELMYPKGACQICGTKIETRKGNIFWARNILHDVPNEMKVTENLGWNSLALCPNCATRWRYSGALPRDFVKKISEYKLTGNEKEVIVDICLHGEKKQVVFAPRHFARLQAVILARLEREENGEYDD